MQVQFKTTVEDPTLQKLRQAAEEYYNKYSLVHKLYTAPTNVENAQSHNTWARLEQAADDYLAEHPGADKVEVTGYGECVQILEVAGELTMIVATETEFLEVPLEGVTPRRATTVVPAGTMVIGSPQIVSHLDEMEAELHSLHSHKEEVEHESLDDNSQG